MDQIPIQKGELEERRRFDVPAASAQAPSTIHLLEPSNVKEIYSMEVLKDGNKVHLLLGDNKLNDI